jgi:hypothetical protein
LLKQPDKQERSNNAEPNKEFGLPEQGKYPMPDKNHAKNAKARASQMEHANLSAGEKNLRVGDKKKIDAKSDQVLPKVASIPRLPGCVAPIHRRPLSPRETSARAEQAANRAPTLRCLVVP